MVLDLYTLSGARDVQIPAPRQRTFDFSEWSECFAHTLCACVKTKHSINDEEKHRVETCLKVHHNVLKDIICGGTQPSLGQSGLWPNSSSPQYSQRYMRRARPVLSDSRLRLRILQKICAQHWGKKGLRENV